MNSRQEIIGGSMKHKTHLADHIRPFNSTPLIPVKLIDVTFDLPENHEKAWNSNVWIFDKILMFKLLTTIKG